MSEPEVQETTETVTEQKQEADVEATESDDATIDALPDWAKREIRKLRKESGDKRTKNKALEDKAAKYDEFIESQKSEQQKLQESHDLLQAKVSEYEITQVRHSIAKEFKLDEDLADLLTGDENQMRATAQKLSDKFKSNVGSSDFHAGNRGASVYKTSAKDFFESLLNDK